jgi:hypothetical protein
LFLTGNEEAARRQGGVLAKMEPVISNGRAVQAQIVELPVTWSTYESGPMLLTPFTMAQEKDLQLQFIHTLTHANFYSARPWIYEGLAHFSQVVLREQQDGRKAALSFLDARRSALALAEPEQPSPNDSASSLINSTDEVFYRTKAMFVWWMLRDMLTEPLLKKALAGYNPDLDKEPAYVQRLLETASNKNLEWFFRDWVYRDRGLPDFQVSAVYPRQNMKGTYLVTVTVENSGNAGADVPIRIRMKDRDVISRLEVMANSKATARIETLEMPIEVIVNDGSVPESDISNNTFSVPAAAPPQ